jgi:hypothetical protein
VAPAAAGPKATTIATSTCQTSAAERRHAASWQGRVLCRRDADVDHRPSTGACDRGAPDGGERRQPRLARWRSAAAVGRERGTSRARGPLGGRHARRPACRRAATEPRSAAGVGSRARDEHRRVGMARGAGGRNRGMGSRRRRRAERPERVCVVGQLRRRVRAQLRAGRRRDGRAPSVPRAPPRLAREPMAPHRMGDVARHPGRRGGARFRTEPCCVS